MGFVGLSQGARRSAFSLRLWQSPLPCLFRLPSAACLLGFHLQSWRLHHSDLCVHCHHISSLPIPPPPPSLLSLFKDPCDYVDPILIIRDDLPSTESLTSPHLCKILFAIQGTGLVVLEMRHGHVIPLSPSCTFPISRKLRAFLCSSYIRSLDGEISVFILSITLNDV